MTDSFQSATNSSADKRLTVGISLFARDGQAIWENGIHQNIAFLAMMLLKSDRIARVLFLNGGDARQIATGLDFGGLDVPLVNPREVTHELDVVIEMGAQLPMDWLRYMKALGKKMVMCFVGNVYSGLGETPIFNQPSGHIFNGGPYDEVWMLPKDEKTARPLLSTLMRVPVHALPHIWSPHFVDRRAATLADAGIRFGYKPGRTSWRLAILEPNISVVKSCHYPMLVADEFYRAQRDGVQHLFVVNAMHMKEHRTFVHFANSLDLVRHHKATFEPRVEVPAFLGEHVDAVISHQWENPQNYLYYDALHGGYPLIHNSPMLGGAGYYYPEFDSATGGRVLHQAWREHDANLDAYRARSAALLQRVSIDNPANLDAYVERLFA